MGLGGFWMLNSKKITPDFAKAVATTALKTQRIEKYKDYTKTAEIDVFEKTN